MVIYYLYLFSLILSPSLEKSRESYIEKEMATQDVIKLEENFTHPLSTTDSYYQWPLSSKYHLDPEHVASEALLWTSSTLRI